MWIAPKACELCNMARVNESGTVEIQTSDGGLDELDEEFWRSLPLALAEGRYNS
jgi:hypothetical protein